MVFETCPYATMRFAYIHNSLYAGTILLYQPCILEQFRQLWVAWTGYVVVGKDVLHSQACRQSAGICELDVIIEYLYRVHYAGIAIVAMNYHVHYNLTNCINRIVILYIVLWFACYDEFRHEMLHDKLHNTIKLSKYVAVERRIVNYVRPRLETTSLKQSNNPQQRPDNKH